MKTMLPSVLVSLSLCWLALEVRGVKNALPSAAKTVAAGVEGATVYAEVSGELDLDDATPIAVKMDGIKLPSVDQWGRIGVDVYPQR